MEDQDFIDSEMNGQPYRAGRHAATLRRQLWREHLGLLPAQDYDAANEPNARPPDVCLNEILEGPENDFVTDPLSDAVWNTWTEQASVNTETYRVLFRADPDDHIKTFDDYDSFYPRGAHKQGHLFDPYMPIAEVREKLDRIKGHLVWLPLEFLCEAEMAEPGLAVNQITEVSYLSYLEGLFFLLLFFFFSDLLGVACGVVFSGLTPFARASTRSDDPVFFPSFRGGFFFPNPTGRPLTSRICSPRGLATFSYLITPLFQVSFSSVKVNICHGQAF